MIIHYFLRKHFLLQVILIQRYDSFQNLIRLNSFRPLYSIISVNLYSIGSITEEDESVEESQASLKLEDTATLLQNFEKSVNNAIEAFKGKNRF